MKGDRVNAPAYISITHTKEDMLVGSLGRNGILEDLVLYGRLYGRYMIWSTTSLYEDIRSPPMDKDVPCVNYKRIECVEALYLDMLEEVCREFSFYTVVVSKSHVFVRW